MFLLYSQAGGSPSKPWVLCTLGKLDVNIGGAGNRQRIHDFLDVCNIPKLFQSRYKWDRRDPYSNALHGCLPADIHSYNTCRHTQSHPSY